MNKLLALAKDIIDIHHLVIRDNIYYRYEVTHYKPCNIDSIIILTLGDKNIFPSKRNVQEVKRYLEALTTVYQSW